MSPEYDAIVIGSGPNGLAAGIAIAQAGRSVLVLEAHEEPGGGMRSAELTLPGFVHDVCSAIHPIGALSPFFRSLGLQEHGLTWCFPRFSVAHPLDRARAAILERSLSATASRLGTDSRAYQRLVEPFVDCTHELFADLLGPLRWPAHPLRHARFGLRALRSARGLAESVFRTEEARALFAGCAAHSVLPLEHLGTSAMGLVFAISAHAVDWPCVRGGSGNLARALVSKLRSLEGQVACRRPVRCLADLPSARAVFFDTTPHAMADIAGDALPRAYRRRLSRFRYGPGVFKVDYALDGSIPWAHEDCRYASTVHVGGTLDEIADAESRAWRGQDVERPHVLVCQQSEMDPSRAPAGKHTGYAYCHVPQGSTADYAGRIERQIERFAPGFRDRIIGRHVLTPSALERYNPSYRGGAITGGANDLAQMFTRPVARLDPYTTPNPTLFICSASAPPGGGVHGMAGYWAAQAALKRGRALGN